MSTIRVKNFYEPDPNSPLYKKVKKHNKFSLDEDRRLSKLVHLYGDDNWEIIADMMRGRSIRQCRERWKHYLSPSVINIPWTDKEDELLERKFKEYGSHWKQIAQFFPNRNYIQIRNRYIRTRRNTRTKNKIVIVSQNLNNYHQNKNNVQQENQFINYSQVQNSYLYSDLNQNKSIDCYLNFNCPNDHERELKNKDIQDVNFGSIFENINDEFSDDFEFQVL